MDKTINRDINKNYYSFRNQVIITTFLIYTVMYISRKSFAAAAPSIMSELGMTTIQFGTASSIYYILYGISKFGSGLLADKIKPRTFLTIALLLIGITTAGIGFSINVNMLLFFYCLTAVAQGSGFPPIAKSINSWFSKSERGTWYSLWNISHNVGGAIAPLLASFIILKTGNWRLAFLVPSIIVFIQAILTFFFMKNDPRSYGLPNVGEWKNDKAQLRINKKSVENISFFKIFYKYILSNPIIWLAIVGDLFIYVIRTVINDWVSVFFVKELNWSLLNSNGLVFYFEIGGILGGLTSGFISDKIFHSDRWKTIIVYIGILILGMLGVFVLIDSSFYIIASLFFIIGSGIYAPQMLFALGIIEEAHVNGVGSATGLKGFVTYIGSALTGLPISLIALHYSWNGVFSLLGIISCMLLFIMVVILYLEKRLAKV